MESWSISDWGSLGSVLSGVATLCILVITFFANQTLQKLSKYANRQKDREVVEKIFLMQEEALNIYTRTASFKESEPMTLLVKAKYIAKLYSLHHIELHLQKLIDRYGQGYTLHYMMRDDYGNPTDHHTQANLEKRSRLVTGMFDYFGDMKPYQNFLQID